MATPILDIVRVLDEFSRVTRESGTKKSLTEMAMIAADFYALTGYRPRVQLGAGKNLKVNTVNKQLQLKSRANLIVIEIQKI